MKSGAKISAKKNLTQEAQKALAQDDVLSDGLEQYHKVQGARIKTKMTSGQNFSPCFKEYCETQLWSKQSKL